MKTGPWLLPSELTTRAVKALDTTRDPAVLAKYMNDLLTHRHPDLIGWGDETYRLPAEMVLFLYRRKREEFKGWLAKAVGQPTSEHFWIRLAALCRDAYEARDWPLLGTLAYQCDRALERIEQRRRFAADARLFPRVGPPATIDLQSAMREAFELSALPMSADGFIKAGWSYIWSLPKWFLGPRQLLQSKGSVADAKVGPSWQLLQMFLEGHPGLWAAVPDGLKQVQEKHPCPYLQQWAKYYPRGEPPIFPVPAAAERENPFTPLAQGVAIELPPLPAPVIDVEIVETEAAPQAQEAPKAQGLFRRIVGWARGGRK